MGTPRGIRLRHHLRHQRGVRLRLPSRQRHGLDQGRTSPTRPLHRHHRRGRLDPYRRGPHAPHHFRPLLPLVAAVRQVQTLGRTTRQTPDPTLQRDGHRSETTPRSRRQGRCRTRTLQTQTRSTSQPPAHALHGRAGNAPPSRKGRTIIPPGRTEKGTLRPQGRTLLRHRREE